MGTKSRGKVNKKVALFIFGGTGDLARRKLYPAIEELLKSGRFPGLLGIYSLGRNESAVSGVRSKFKELGVSFEFIEFDVRDRDYYGALSDRIVNLPGVELIFYLALPPALFESTIVHLGSLLRAFTNPRKIVIEKPFGFDSASAKRLNFQLRRYFTEEEIYRIDHFLGKLQVQNILSVRFSNYVFEGIWNKNFIDNVQVSALEDIGLEGRGAYYDDIGALRDMVQNHMLQIMSFLAMEPPAAMDPEKVRDEKVKVLESVRRLSPEDVDRFTVRGQYRGYTEELGRESRTETFVALKLYIDNFRWEGVPFYLRTGKRLCEKRTQAIVVFKEVPPGFGRLVGCAPERNKIAFEIAPRNRLVFKFQVLGEKGGIACPVETSMETSVSQNPPEAYATLLEDVLTGDRSMFIREDESELAWEIVQPVLDRWEEDGKPVLYEPGTMGPVEAEKLVEKDGRKWELL